MLSVVVAKMFKKEKWTIIRGVLWLKVGFFLWTLGMYAILPYINLQMASLGLSEEDLGLIWGIMPFFIIPFLPLAGSQLFFQTECILGFKRCIFAAKERI